MRCVLPWTFILMRVRWIWNHSNALKGSSRYWIFDLAKLFINQIDTLQVSGRNEGIGMIGLLPLTILLDCYDSFNVKLKNEWTRYLSVRWNKLTMWQSAVSCATLAAGWNTFSAKTVVFLQKNIISSASSASFRRLLNFFPLGIFILPTYGFTGLSTQPRTWAWSSCPRGFCAVNLNVWTWVLWGKTVY